MRVLLLLPLLVPLAAGCLSGGDGPGEGRLAWRVAPDQRLTPDGESASEVSVAVDPKDPRHAVAAANSAGGFGVYVTFDGGVAWSAHRLAPADVAALPGDAGRFQFLSDPAVAFGPDGTLYLAGLAYVPTSAVFVARSAAGDGTWDAVAVVHESDLATSFNDKEWLAAGPDGLLVAAWQQEPAMDQLRGVEGALAPSGLDIDLGTIVVACSHDGGATWGAPVAVSRGLHNNGTQAAVTPDGRIHLLWVNYETPGLDHAASADGCATWSEPAHVADVDTVGPFPRYARMHTLPALAADLRVDGGGALYAVWHDERDGEPDVLAVASTDGGTTWSQPVRVNDEAPDEPGVPEGIQIYPWAAVDGQGRLHVTYYDSRHDAHPRFHYRHSVAAGPGLDFVDTGPVSSVDFTAFNGPDGSADEARGLGDYTGLAGLPDGVLSAWADGRGEASAVHAATVRWAEGAS